MLISQEARCRDGRRQGSPAGRLAELRRQLARPTRFSEGNRQRLLDLARRLAAVQALGDGYVRVEFSEHALEALGQGARENG